MKTTTSNKKNDKVEEEVEQSIRKYFSVITPNAGLLKGKEQIAGTITLYMLKNFVLGEIAKVCDTSSYEQGVRDERERIERELSDLPPGYFQHFAKQKIKEIIKNN